MPSDFTGNAILIKTNKQNNEIVKNATDEINRMLCQRIIETVSPLGRPSRQNSLSADTYVGRQEGP